MSKSDAHLMTLKTRMLRCKMSVQVQDSSVVLGMDQKRWKDDIDSFSPKGVLERASLESETLLSSKSSMPNRSSETLKSVSRSCSLHEITRFNQHGCFRRTWKNLMLQCLHFFSAKKRFSRFYMSSYGCSIRNCKCHRVISLPVKAIVSEGNTYEPDMINISRSWRCFTYEEISLATNYFNPGNSVGSGGHSDVYKGILPNGETIAVKKLFQDETNISLTEKEFLEEIGIMGHLFHPNVVPLIGFCLEHGLYLVFPFYPSGSLFTLLHVNGHHMLDWGIRFKIALGTARGIHYLHSSCKRRIIHRDIKASNILIGSDFEPLISDFGLAKWLPTSWTQFSLIPVEGTFGYLAPEYVMHGIVDEKIDVFSFGVLLLEIISGRRPIDASQQSLVLWARHLLDSGNIQALADPELGGTYDVNQMQNVMLAAEMCIRQSALSRPSMKQVLQILIEGDCSNSPIC